MQLLDDRLLLSATDLINHLECAHLSHLDLEVVNGRASIEETREEAAELVARKGDEHEATYLESLRAAGREVARQRASRASPAWSVAPSAPARRCETGPRSSTRPSSSTASGGAGTPTSSSVCRSPRRLASGATALKVVGSRDDLAGHVVQRRPGDPPVAAHGC